jgi:hypothetical protein
MAAGPARPRPERRTFRRSPGASPGPPEERPAFAFALDQDHAPQDARYNAQLAALDDMEDALARGDYGTVADALDTMSRHAAAGARHLRAQLAPIVR